MTVSEFSDPEEHRGSCLNTGNESPTVSLFLEQYFGRLNECGLSYAVMRNYEGLPRKNPGHDIDILVMPGDLDRHHKVFQEQASKQGWRVFQRLHRPQIHIVRLFKQCPHSRELYLLRFDLFTMGSWHGAKFLDAKAALERRRAYGEFPVFVVDPLDEVFLIISHHLLWTGYLVKDEYRRLIKRVKQEYEPALEERMRETFGKKWGENLIRVAAEGERLRPGEGWRVRSTLLARRGLANIYPDGLVWLRAIGATARQYFSPPGLCVVVLGPDGSGKSTMIRAIVPILTPLFRGPRIFHLRPQIGVRKKGPHTPVTDPHGSPARSRLLSIIKIFYYLLDYTVGHVVTVRPALMRSTLIIFDRYYHDLLVDPLRYRYGGPMWLARWVGKLIPRPDLWILLDAPPEVLQTRKQEVPMAETVRQREAYLALVHKFDNAVVVDVSQPFENVVADVNAAILDFMAQRTRARHGL